MIGKIHYPEAYHGTIVILTACENELKAIIEKCGDKAFFRVQYRKRLEYLDEHKVQAVFHNEWFESLRDCDGIYAMRFNKGRKNIRILYGFAGGVPHLLLCFSEKSAGKDKSYRKYVPTAQKRLDAVLKDQVGGSSDG